MGECDTEKHRFYYSPKLLVGSHWGPGCSLLSASEELFNQPFVVAVVGLSCAGVGSGALSGIIRHHSDHVQQTGEQLQGEVEDTNPQT